MSNMQVIEAYSRLKSLRQNVPTGSIETKFVEEFHQILELLEGASGTTLENFRIPASEIRPIVTGGNYLTGEQRYSNKPYCDYHFFVMKVDGVLTMFELLVSQGQGSSGKTTIGFKPYNK
jgi:hypothetical protein